MNKLEIGMKFASEGKMLKYVDLDSTNTKQKKKNLEWLKQFVTYEKTGKMSKGNVTNEIIITEVSNIPEKEDGRGKSEGSRGNNTGHYKYYNEFRETMLWIMRDWEIGKPYYKFMKNLMTESGAVSEKIFKVEFIKESDIKQLQYRKSRVKNAIVRDGLERMAKEKLIDYKESLFIIDSEGEERDIYDFEKDKYKEVSKEVLEQMGYEGFDELEREDILNPKKYILHNFNNKVRDRMYKIYGWIGIKCNRIEIVKNTELVGSDMRKQLNDKVLATYKQYLDKKNDEYLEGIYEELCASPFNAGREDDLIGRYGEKYEDILSDFIENDKLVEQDEVIRKKDKRRVIAERIKKEDEKAKFDKEVEVAIATTREAKRSANSLQINKRFTPVEDDYDPFKEVDDVLF